MSNEFGEFLRELRGKMTFREAAERSGISHAYIRYLEIGKRPGTNTPINPSPDMIKGLAKAYNYPYEELMKKAGYLSDEENTENPDSNEPEFLKRLDMDDENLLKQYTLVLDGEELTPEAAKMAIAFLRTALASSQKN